jgi:hypothetical protein
MYDKKKNKKQLTYSIYISADYAIIRRHNRLYTVNISQLYLLMMA